MNSLFTELQVMLEVSAEAVGVQEGALEEVVVEGRRVLQENMGDMSLPRSRPRNRPWVGAGQPEGKVSLTLERVLRAIKHKRSQTQPVGVHSDHTAGAL